MRAYLLALFRGDTDRTIIQFFRATIVGGCAFAVDFTCLFVLTSYCHVHYLISAGIAFIVGVATNYVLSITWVFSTRKMKSWWSEFIIFAAIGLGGFVLNEAFIWFFTEIVLLYYLISKVLSTIIVYSYNFLARKFLLFS